jgi:hypothetical protein
MRHDMTLEAQVLTQQMRRAAVWCVGIAALIGLGRFAAAEPLSLDESGAAPKVTTPGGCVIALDGADAAWRITLADGKSARVTLEGRSVTVTEAGGQAWRVPGSMSFILPDGTKVTLGMKMDRQNGLVPESLHVANGDDDVIISGLFKSKFKAAASAARTDNEGRFADGDYAVMDGEGRFFLLRAAQVAQAKAGKATAARITGAGDAQFEAKPSADVLVIPPAALPLLVPAEDEP